MAASATVHRFQEITEIANATTSQTAPTTRDVTQSQLTAGDSLVIEQPHGLETITNTDRSAARRATTAKAMAMELVARSPALRETAMTQVYVGLRASSRR
jgi:hypothetical protein